MMGTRVSSHMGEDRFGHCRVLCEHLFCVHGGSAQSPNRLSYHHQLVGA